MTEEIFEKARAIVAAEVEAVALHSSIHDETATDRELLESLEKTVLILRARTNRAFAPLEEKKSAIEQMKADLLANLGGITDAASDGVTITVKHAGGVQALWVEEKFKKHPEELPEQFHKTKIELNTDAIRERLAEGTELPFAKLLPRKRTVVIEVTGK